MGTTGEAEETSEERRKGRVDLGRAARFGAVGLVNSVIDFGAFSVLRLLGVGLLLSNVVSTSLGMAFSFFANRRFVFASGGDLKRQVLLFVAGTAFSMYVLQSIVILGVTRFFPVLLDDAVVVAGWFGVRSPATTMLVRSNAAKVAATTVSMTWNFCFYRWAVFAPTKPAQGDGPDMP